MRLITAPENLTFDNEDVSLFLGGATDGQSENWQDQVIDSLKDLNVVILDPRRANWDQLNEKELVEQIEWELEAQYYASALFYYFHPACKCPVTLLELGLHASHGSLGTVCCPPEFWRHINVKVICDWYEIPLLHSLDESITLLRKKLS